MFRAQYLSHQIENLKSSGFRIIQQHSCSYPELCAKAINALLPELSVDISDSNELRLINSFVSEHQRLPNENEINLDQELWNLLDAVRHLIKTSDANSCV